MSCRPHDVHDFGSRTWLVSGGDWSTLLSLPILFVPTALGDIDRDGYDDFALRIDNSVRCSRRDPGLTEVWSSATLQPVASLQTLGSNSNGRCGARARIRWALR